MTGWAITEPTGEPMDTADQAAAHAEMHREVARISRYFPPADEQIRDPHGRGFLCIDCLELIPAARMAAMPLAVRCVGCQEQAERLYHGGR